MRKIVFAATLLLLGAVLMFQTSCYYDNEETLYPSSSGCDTSSVKYSTDVSVIVQNNCTTCHSASGVQSNSPMDSYTALKVYVNSGSLLDRTNNTNSPMPPTGLLSDCDRAKIRAWISGGALNN